MEGGFSSRTKRARLREETGGQSEWVRGGRGD